MPTFHKALSAETRRKIIMILARHRSYRDLAGLLGVSPAAIHKYLTGKSQPGDAVVEKALRIADRYERGEIAAIVSEELAVVLEDFLRWALEDGSIDPADIEKLGSIIARAKLSRVLA